MFGGDEPVGQVALRAEAPVSRTVAPSLVASIQRRPGGRYVFRDMVATAGVRVVDEGTLTVIVRPGVRIPTGGVAEGLSFTPRSTASLDPWLASDVVVGADWLFVGSVQGQVPLYRGWDNRRQGAYGRADLQIARRVGGKGIVRTGLSGAGRLEDDLGQDDFFEVAWTAGATLLAHQRVSLGANTRVPVWMGPNRPYVFGVGVNATFVVGKPIARKDEDEG